MFRGWKYNIGSRINELRRYYTGFEVLLRLADENTIHLYRKMKEKLVSILCPGNHFTVHVSNVTLAKDIADLRLPYDGMTKVVSSKGQQTKNFET